MKPIVRVITYAIPCIPAFVLGMCTSAHFLGNDVNMAKEIMNDAQRQVENLGQDVENLRQAYVPFIANSLKYELSIVEKYIILTTLNGSLTKEEYMAKNEEIKDIEQQIDLAAGDGLTKSELHKIQKKIDELCKDVAGNDVFDEKEQLDRLRNLEEML